VLYTIVSYFGFTSDSAYQIQWRLVISNNIFWSRSRSWIYNFNNVLRMVKMVIWYLSFY